jgi:protein O-GlcNAc transferase
LQTSAQGGLLPGLLEERGKGWLHIGGAVRKAGWEVLNAQAGEHVDHVGDLRDLSRFASESFDMVYVSHVLEHVSHQELPRILKDLARILRPGGRLFAAVPDMKALCWIFANPKVREEERLELMHIMFGAQIDEHDFHKTGLWDWYLANLLAIAGLAPVYRVKRFGLFEDTSDLMIGDVPLSLNMVAVKG